MVRCGPRLNDIHMATTNTAAAAAADAAAIVIDQSTDADTVKRIWSGVLSYGRKTTAGYPVKRLSDGKIIGMLKPTSRKLADTSGAMRSTYADSMNVDMPDMLWRHCLEWLAYRHCGVKPTTAAAAAADTAAK